MGRGFVCVVIAAGAIVSGCGGGNGGGTLSCIQGLSPTCSTLYPAPTYDHLFTRTFTPKCNLTNCHGPPNPGNGLAFDDEQHSYDLLLGNVGGKVRVNPGAPSCSLLVERIESSDPNLIMPRGNPMTAAERCDIEQWIFMGAMR
jgi:hypothetical protein